MGKHLDRENGPTTKRLARDPSILRASRHALCLQSGISCSSNVFFSLVWDLMDSPAILWLSSRPSMKSSTPTHQRTSFTHTPRREALRGAFVLFDEGAISKGGFNGPYARTSRQKGFVSFGVSHVMKILGSAEVSQRSSWYQKWNVHLFARPEVSFCFSKFTVVAGALL